MDVVKFSCPKCGQHYSAPRERIGTSGKCGKCGARFRLHETGATLAVPADVPPAAPPIRSRTPTPVYSQDSQLHPSDLGAGNRTRPTTGRGQGAVRVRGSGAPAWQVWAAVGIAAVLVLGGVFLLRRRSSSSMIAASPSAEAGAAGGAPTSSDPRSADEFVARGRVRRAKGDLEGATGDFTSAIDLDPRNTKALR